MKGEWMTKRHFMATHTWLNEETRDAVLEASSSMTDVEFFANLKTDKAETLAHWMGKEDFFFCHWYAIDENAIFEALETAGLNELMVTMPSEMHRYVTTERLTGEKLLNPFAGD